MIRIISLGAVLIFASFNTALAETPLTYDRINLSVSAGESVENDILKAVLFAQQEGNDAARLAREVNRDISRAVKQAKGVAGVKVQTLEYSTSPIYRNQSITGWRVRQSIRLESRDAASLSKLIGTLQEHLGVSNISYALSPEGRKTIEDKLIARAISRFKQRAALISNEMEQSGYRLVQMNINGSGISPRPVQMRAMAMELKGAPSPTLEAGSQRVVVNINGTIELKP